MFAVAVGEILIVVVIRPLRWLLGGERTRIGRVIFRAETWLLNQLHAMGAESRMRHELEMHGQASAYLAESLSNPQDAVPSVSETLERTRRQTGADELRDKQRQEASHPTELRRAPRQVASAGGDRSADIQRELLEAQRRQRAEAERARRRQSRF